MSSFTMFACSSCSHLHVLWSARCLKCGKLGTIRTRAELAAMRPTDAPVTLEAIAAATAPAGALLPSSMPVPLTEVSAATVPRDATGLAPFDEVTGGGLARGGAYMLGGSPGAGKSTLLMQAIASSRLRTLYATGEETIAQVSERAHRIGAVCSTISVVCETDVATVLRHASELRIQLLVIDSIKTLVSGGGAAGSQLQMVACTSALIRYAKLESVAVVLVAHVNHDDRIAGPNTLAHLVDVVMMFDAPDRRSDLRILQIENKNRFGPNNRVGRFLMTAQGLMVAPDPEPEIDDGNDTDASDDPALS